MPPTIAAGLDEIIRLVPGYDPFATSEGYWFDAEAGQRAIDFFPACITHVKGELAGQPFVLELWEQAIIANLFGWKGADGFRRYREAFVYVPRKNGKTAFVAGIVNMVMFTDGEPGAEIYSAAADREQAALVFEQVKGMVLNEPELSSRARIYRKAICFEAMNTTYKPISSEALTKHGYNTHLAVIDELHAQPNRDLVDVLETSTGSRRQPLIIHITTADYARESICNEKLDYAEKVRDGIIEDPRFLPVIYGASLDDDWTDPEVWRKANPNLGVSLSEEWIAAKCKQAQESPAFENTFKRLHLNIQTEQDVRWLKMAKWDACDGALPDLKGRECFAGLDLSSTSDLTSLSLVFPPIEADPLWYILPFFWVPGENAHKRERKDKVPYIMWARQGHCELTDGDIVDYEMIRKKVDALGEIYNIREIAADMWNATHIITELGGDGFDVIPFGQGYKSMSAPTKELEKLIIGGQIAHGGHPVLRWNASNVTVEIDAAENMKPSKKKSTERIDGIVATIMGLGRAMERTEAGSVYDKRDLIVL